MRRDGVQDWPADRTCPECGGVVYASEWWDDTPEMGGAHIGTRFDCSDCAWFDDC